MYEPLRHRTLALLKVPLEPHPPTGDPASLRVFRAGRNYFRLRLAGWAVTQVFALAGILFWTAMLFEVEALARAQQAARENPRRETTAAATPSAAADLAPASTAPKASRGSANWGERFGESVKAAANAVKRGGEARRNKLYQGWAGYKQLLVEVALVLPPWAFPVIWALKIFGLGAYLIQLPLTYAVRRLDYEMRWYMVTDRSMRLRHGVWKITETTMSFANVQQVTVTQGPLQRLLGLANVKVQSAGGGGGKEEYHEYQHHGEDMHVGLFQSVTNATEIRDLILERLRLFRATGLGDPDEARPSAAAPRVDAAAHDTLAAARELLAEARALRAAVS